MTPLKFVLFYFVFISFMTLLTKHPSTKKPTISSELSANNCVNSSSNINVSNISKQGN